MPIFTIIYGYRTRNNVMGQTQHVCKKCGQNTPHAVVRTKMYMTLFFVPLFPISKKTTARCGSCGFQEKMDNKQADGMFPSVQQA